MDNRLASCDWFSTVQTGGSIYDMKYFTLASADNQEVPWQKAANLLHLIDIHLNNSVI